MWGFQCQRGAWSPCLLLPEGQEPYPAAFIPDRIVHVQGSMAIDYCHVLIGPEGQVHSTPLALLVLDFWL